MICAQISTHLIAYLDRELPSGAQKQIQEHLEHCSNCRSELRSLSELQSRLGRHLHQEAERVHPEPEAWNTLQAAISAQDSGWKPDGLRHRLSRFRYSRLSTRRWALALLVILALLLAAPPTWVLASRVSAWVGRWFHFPTPGGEDSMSLGGFEAFTPFTPSYLPEGFQGSGAGGESGPDFETLTLTYSRGEQFVSLLQSKGAGAEGLPSGEKIFINGKTGVFVPVFATSSAELQQKITSIPIVTNFDYGTSSLLGWHTDEIRIMLVSNLPKEELVQIARWLVPAQSGPDVLRIDRGS